MVSLGGGIGLRKFACCSGEKGPNRLCLKRSVKSSSKGKLEGKSSLQATAIRKRKKEKVGAA